MKLELENEAFAAGSNSAKSVTFASIVAAAGGITEADNDTSLGSYCDTPDDAFPTESLPEPLRSAIQEVARFTQTPDALAACVGIGVVSAATGGGARLQLRDGSSLPANLFIMGIARSGVGKGRVYSSLSAPLKDAESTLAKKWRENSLPAIIADLEVATARAKRLSQAAAKEDDDAARKKLTDEYRAAESDKQQLEAELHRQPQIIISDITSEMLAIKLSTQPNEAIASHSPEARGIINVLSGRYSKSGFSDEAIYLSGYSGDSIQVDRVGRPGVRLNKPCLSILWLAQPDVIRRMLSDERMTESGLLPRFMIADINADPQDEPQEKTTLSQFIMGNWSELINRIVYTYRQCSDIPGVVSMSVEADEVRRQFANECCARYRKRGDLHDVPAYPARWMENACRLALCLHVVEHGADALSVEVSSDGMANAISITKWFARQQLALLSPGRSNKLLQRMSKLRSLLLEKNGRETVRNLVRRHGFELEELQQLAAKFPDHLGLCKIKPAGAEGGRPSLVASLTSLVMPAPHKHEP